MNTELAEQNSENQGSSEGTEIIEANRGYGGILHQKPLSELAGSGFLPMFQFLSNKSEAVSSGVVPEPGYYIKTGTNKFVSLGKEVIVYPITYRALALDASERPDKITSVYDTSDPEFTRIQENSNVSDSGCMWGPQFLVWIPSWKVKNRFATFFCCSKSQRREAGNFDVILNEQGFAKLGFGIVKTSKYTWQNITVQSYSGSIELPPRDMLEEVLTKFTSPPNKYVGAENTVEDAEVEGERPR